MEEEIKIFDEYVGNFDLKDERILRKKEHSCRVMNFAKSIAESLKLNEADIYILQHLQVLSMILEDLIN